MSLSPTVSLTNVANVNDPLTANFSEDTNRTHNHNKTGIGRSIFNEMSMVLGDAETAKGVFPPTDNHSANDVLN